MGVQEVSLRIPPRMHPIVYTFAIQTVHRIRSTATASSRSQCAPPRTQPTSSWRPPSWAGPLAEIVGSGESITSPPDCDAPTGQQKRAQLRGDGPLLHSSTVMCEPTDNLRDTYRRKPDGGNCLLWTCRACWTLSPASTWTHFRGRRGPVSLASLGLLSFLSNRAELQLRGPTISSP